MALSPLTFFVISCILDVWQSSKYASVIASRSVNVMKESDNSLNQVNKPEQSTGLSEIFDSKTINTLK